MKRRVQSPDTDGQLLTCMMPGQRNTMYDPGYPYWWLKRVPYPSLADAQKAAATLKKLGARCISIKPITQVSSSMLPWSD